MADEIIVKYQADVKDANKSLDSYIKTTEKAGTTSDKTTKKIEKDWEGVAGNISGSLKQIAGAIGIAFGTQQIVQFGKEAIQLAGRLEGVERAFNKLNRPNLLANLRKATRGTVSDLELMRQAVRAQNFQVPLEKLASFFEFATKRSIETGESVDYLVSSIIDGIGRKSTLVLDNLGISATELQEEIKRTGDFGEAAGNIIARSLEETGDVADTTAIKIQQLNIALENTQTALGEGLIDAMTALTDPLTETAENLGAAEGETALLDLASQSLANTIKGQSAVWILLSEGLAAATSLFKESEEAIGDWSDDADRATELLREMGEVYVPVLKNLAYYNDLIKELKAEQASANTTRERVRELEDEINEAIRQRLILLGRLRVAGGDTYQEILTTAQRGDQIQVESTYQTTDDILKNWDYRQAEIKRKQEELNRALSQENAAYEAEQAALYEETFYEVAGMIATLSEVSNAARNQELANLQEQLRNRQITEEEYDRKRRQILSEKAEEEKGYAIFQATINTAQAVVAALGSQPFTPANIALAAAVGAAGALQIGLIASQPVPQFEEGGWVDPLGRIHGRSHRHGGVLIEAEGNEYITRGRYAIPNAKLLEAINTGNADKYIMENHVAPIVSNILEGGLGALGDSLHLNNMFNDKNLLKLGDRNRIAARKDAQYIVKELSKAMKPRRRGGYA